jgi:DNA-binding NtrC family response regulator
MIDGRVKGLGPDLSSRLGAISIRVPALRERMGDFPALTAHFVNEWNRNHRKAVQLDSPVVELLAGYSWPGNLHQLQGVIATLLWRTKRTRLTLDDLEPGIAIWRDRRSSRALDEELYGRAGEALGTYLRDHL